MASSLLRCDQPILAALTPSPVHNIPPRPIPSSDPHLVLSIASKQGAAVKTESVGSDDGDDHIHDGDIKSINHRNSNTSNTPKNVKPDDDLFKLKPIDALQLLSANLELLVRITGDVPPTPPLATAPADTQMSDMQAEKESIARSHSEKNLAKLRMQALKEGEQQDRHNQSHNPTHNVDSRSNDDANTNAGTNASTNAKGLQSINTASHHSNPQSSHSSHSSHKTQRAMPSLTIVRPEQTGTTMNTKTNATTHTATNTNPATTTIPTMTTVMTTPTTSIDGVRLKHEPNQFQDATPTSAPPPPGPEPYIIVGSDSQPVNVQHSAITRRFYSRNEPPITVNQYLLRLHQFCPMSTGVYLATSLYIYRLAVQERVIPVTRRNAHRLVLAGLRVAMKALEDLAYSHSKVAKVGGVSEAELARLEINFCFLAGFDLVVGEKALREHWELLKCGGVQRSLDQMEMEKLSSMLESATHGP